MKENYSELAYQSDLSFTEAVEACSYNLLDEYNAEEFINDIRIKFLKDKGYKNLLGEDSKHIPLNECKEHRVSQAFVRIYNQSKRDIEEYPGFLQKQQEKKAFDEDVNDLYLKLDNQIHWYDRNQEELDSADMFTPQEEIDGHKEKQIKISSEISDIVNSCTSEQLPILKKKVGPDKWKKYVQ